MALTRINNQSLTNVTSAGLPSGTVLQVVSETSDTQDGTDNTSYTSPDISALSINITPNSTSSKILLLMDIQTYVDGNGNNVYFNIYRDGTNITGSASGNGSRSYVTTQMVTTSSMSFTDSPSTTSQITYDVRFYVSGGNGYVSVNNGQSQLTAMEIAG